MLPKNPAPFLAIVFALALLVALLVLPVRAQPAHPGDLIDASAAEQGNKANLTYGSLPPYDVSTAYETTKTVDDQGVVTWNVTYSDSNDYSACTPVSKFRYPIDLGAQDPTAFGPVILTLNYYHHQYVVSAQAKDPSWSVGLNGAPPDQWQLVGDLDAPVSPNTNESRVLVSQAITITGDLLQDGENNIWLKQHETCPVQGCNTCACTCINLVSASLRAAPSFNVVSFSPADGARNVRIDQSKDRSIWVRFSRQPDPDTLSQGVELYYYDRDMRPAQVQGHLGRVAGLDYIFYPDKPLIDGIQYTMEVWGKENAEAAGRSGWVKSIDGYPLERSRVWSFWTMPELEVQVAPVQVLENEALVAGKPTAIKVYLRWETKENVFPQYQLETVEVNDIRLKWEEAGAVDAGQAAWKDGGLWRPSRTAQSMQRKREYQSFDQAGNSYDKFEKLASEDSIIYVGFVPVESETRYDISAEVELLDHQGKPQVFSGQKSLESSKNEQLNLFVKALAVGARYTATGTEDLSLDIDEGFSAYKGIFPTASVRYPDNASAIPWYTPATTLWWNDWKTEPAAKRSLHTLMGELNTLCLKTSNCDIMLGYARARWMKALGLSLRESYPNALMVMGADMSQDTGTTWNFVLAHEIGHTLGIDYHIDLFDDDGYWVQGSVKDRRANTARMLPTQGSVLKRMSDFMTEEPVELPPDYRLWISALNYRRLNSLYFAARPAETGPAAMDRPVDVSQALGEKRVSADGLLLASGGVTEPGGVVELLPWYLLEPGEYREPASGPYQIRFLNASGQELSGYTRTFTTTGTMDPAEPGLFSFKIPYPSATAKVQIRRVAGSTLLKEIVPSAAGPGLSLNPPAAGAWTGQRTLSWNTSGSGPRHYSVDISTDNGVTWEAQAIHLANTSFTFDTRSFPNTSTAWVRVMVTDGLRTTTVKGGPYTFANPLQVSYVSPSKGERGVGIETEIVASFRDAMKATSLTTATFKLSGGPYGSVPGQVVYEAEAKEATLRPAAPLAYSTRYTATLTTGIQGLGGGSLPAAVTWTFTTTQRSLAPAPLVVSPARGARFVVRDAVIAVAWDAALDPASLTAARFSLAPVGGGPLAGTIAWDVASRTATLTPGASLLANQAYIVRLKAGIADTSGNQTVGETSWVFKTGAGRLDGPAFTGSFMDEGRDEDGDGLFDRLVIRAGVQVKLAGMYVLSGRLLDSAGVEIGQAAARVTLPAGGDMVELAFSGPQIGGHGVDGPYTVAGLALHPDGLPGQVVAYPESYRTLAYAAEQFPSPLEFSGLPDVGLLPGKTLDPAFNVRSYARHSSLSPDQLSYALIGNSDPTAGVSLGSDGGLSVAPPSGYTGVTEVTIQAGDGTHAVQDRFRVSVAWVSTLYLPVTLNKSTGPVQPVYDDFWRIAFSESFDEDPATATYPGWDWGWYPLPAEGVVYRWNRTDCAAASGQYSFWPFGFTPPKPCGPNQPWGDQQGVTTDPQNEKYPERKTVNLEQAAAAQLSFKALYNLSSGYEFCGLVAKEHPWPYQLGQYAGICRSGQSNSWEDISLDLANVPTLGSLLGQKDIRIALDLRTPDVDGEWRATEAYVDDLQVRVCLRGLPCQPAGLVAPAPAAGPVGGFTGSQWYASALAIEQNGRIHMAWTGKVNWFPERDTEDRQKFLFYSTSTDGVKWTPAQAITGPASDIGLAVDDARHLVHLVYNGPDGAMHHTIKDGIVSQGMMIFSTAGGTVSSPAPQLGSVAVDPSTGYLHALQNQGYFYNSPTSIGLVPRFRTSYLYWDGARWSAPMAVINNIDTRYQTLAAAPGKGVMLAWFQDWDAGLNEGEAADEPRQARTALGPGGLSGFPLRQAVSDFYDAPENDQSILLATSADGKFYLLTEHSMWPSHSRVYRYVWQNGSWSAPLDISANTEKYAVPVAFAPLATAGKVVYLYRVNGVLMLRTEINGVLGPAENLDAYLANLGYTFNSALIDRNGTVHMLATKAGEGGVYYLRK